MSKREVDRFDRREMAKRHKFRRQAQMPVPHLHKAIAKHVLRTLVKKTRDVLYLAFTVIRRTQNLSNLQKPADMYMPLLAFRDGEM